ncbi:MAG: hypothetical protein J2P37_34005, partial [Ktedonobacteraceae bacterium]|nr:hypothetical protein [Ktedonobacteraceae bacterium]
PACYYAQSSIERHMHLHHCSPDLSTWMTLAFVCPSSTTRPSGYLCLINRDKPSGGARGGYATPTRIVGPVTSDPNVRLSRAARAALA